MTYDQIHNLFKQRYSQSNWKQFLGEAFATSRLLETPEILTGIDSNVASQVQKLGYITLNENGIERQIAVYEVTLAQGIILERNRVGLRNLLRKYWKDIDAAFIAYHRPESPKWRFTYVSELTGYDADGEFVKIKTEPKCYTYVLGEGESTRTAAERFTAIANKGSKATLEDVKEAFSVEKLSKAFFDEYKKHYDIFCDFMVSKPSIRQTIFNGDEKGIRDFNKKLLGRIVFLYFIQKKGWLGVPSKSDWGKGDFYFLTNLFKNTKNPDLFYSDLLSKLFFDTLNTKRKDDLIELVKGEPCRIPYLNGGLFEEDDKKHRNLIFPSNLFKSLFDFFNQYNFTIYEDDPNDHTVAVDPEMLGHIFENLLEDNKDKGAYYTPKEIVHYMCQESLIEYLHTQLPDYEKENFELLVRSNQVAQTFTNHKKANEINDKLKAVKVCDPAIGSGAFPMGLLKEIFECRRLLYPYLKTNEAFDPATVKKEIIQQNIYGVDLENGAVEIARLRFWLALVVDETVPQPLPNLDYKIMQGNSLLERFESVDLSHVANNNLKIAEPVRDLFGNIKESQMKITYTKTEIVAQIQKRMKLFYALENAEEKQQYRDEINELVHEHIEFNFDLRKSQIKRWIAEFESSNTKTDKVKKKLAEYQKQLADLKVSNERLKELETRNDKPFFLWKLFFADVFAEGGFDIMIGNPPYIQLQKMTAETDILQEANYETFTRTGDIYCLFYEQGNKLLKPNGTLCYITSNSWLKTQYGEMLRNYFVEHTNPLKLLNFEDTKIFQTATVETNIFISRKASFQNSLHAVAIKPDYKIGLSVHDYFRENSFILSDLSSDGWIILSKQDDELKKHIEDNTTKLGNCNLQLYIGLLIGFNEAFVIDETKRKELIALNPQSKNILKPILRGRDIQKYSFKWEHLWLIFSHNGIKKLGIDRVEVEKDYPAIYEHLSNYKKELIVRHNQGDHWTNMRNCAYLKEFEMPKIIWGEISDKPKFAYDTSGILANDRCSFMVGEDLKLILTLLNSKLIEWYFNKISTSSGMGTNMWKHYKIKLLPIAKIKNEKTKQKFEVLADYLIYLNDESNPPVNPYTNNASIAPVFEDVLNMMVYELYFEQHMKEEEIDVLKFVDEKHFPVLTNDKEKDKELIGKVYRWLQEQDNQIRNRVILSNIKSKNIIKRINSTTH